jgi:hypothetical protein
MPGFYRGFENFCRGFAGFLDPNAGVLHFGDGTPVGASSGRSTKLEREDQIQQSKMW